MVRKGTSSGRQSGPQEGFGAWSVRLAYGDDIIALFSVASRKTEGSVSGWRLQSDELDHHAMV